MITIKTALISVYHKDRLDEIAGLLHDLNIKIVATGGTETYIKNLDIPVTSVEALTSYPSILGGRVKTLHPKIFGGILGRRGFADDTTQLETYDIPEIDLVIVDLYPFEETVKTTQDEEEIIEKIDIGGISLIRAAAKNFKDVLIIPSRNNYPFLIDLLKNKKGSSTLQDRKRMAGYAFRVSSHYDTAILNYFTSPEPWKEILGAEANAIPLRYGENPHQQGKYFGRLNEIFEKLNGKELSYNNLLDLDAAISLMSEFTDCTVAVIKHNNACGTASRPHLTDAWKAALAGDPISAFGGIIITNRNMDAEAATEIGKLFFEIIIAPDYDEQALAILKEKKNRIILKQHAYSIPDAEFRTVLNGVLWQEKDKTAEHTLKTVTTQTPSEKETDDLIFANKIMKHLKSNAIVLAKEKQMLGSGAGQTSRVDALEQAVAKAIRNGFDLKGAVMASDAFFPFPDCVAIAGKAGITAVIQPGGSVKDKDSIDYCDANNMSMVLTGIRHFKH